MSLLFMDGAEVYTTEADLEKRWNYDPFQASSFCSVQAGLGRNGGASIHFSNNAHLGKQTGVNAGTLIAGFAFSSAGSATSNGWLCSFGDSGTEQISLFFDGTGHLQVRRGSNLGTFGGTTLGTGTKFFANSTYHYIEIKVVFDNSAGAVTVKVDGVTDISLSGIDTTQTANNYANTFHIGDRSNAHGVTEYDDVYLCDASGSLNNDFLGDIRIVGLVPTGAGNYAQWTPSTGSNWQNVDETGPNGDTDYNSDSTPGHRDSFVMGDLPTGAASVLAVQYTLVARKDDAGTRQVAPFVRISGTDYDGTTVSVTTTYDTYRELKETSPATSAAWTPSEVNGMEYGVKEVA